MKQKIGTVLDPRLIRRAKIYAAQSRQPLNSVIEAALSAWLDRTTSAPRAGVIGQTAGNMAIPPDTLRELLSEDAYDDA